eukprot:2789349-Pleurochrysis_carterae.AAC.2
MARKAKGLLSERTTCLLPTQQKRVKRSEEWIVRCARATERALFHALCVKVPWPSARIPVTSGGGRAGRLIVAKHRRAIRLRPVHASLMAVEWVRSAHARASPRRWNEPHGMHAIRCAQTGVRRSAVKQ